jgi:hypothetical protein
MRIIKAPNGAESAPLSLCVQTPFSNWNVIRGVSNVKEKRKLSSGLTTLRPSVVNCFAASIPHRWVSECWTEFPVPRCLRTRGSITEMIHPLSRGLSKEDFLGG